MKNRRLNRLAVATLIMSMIFTTTTPVSAAKIDKVDKKNNQISKLAKEFGVTEQFVQDELNGGVSATELGNALKLSKWTKKPYKETLKQLKPQQANKSKEVKSKIVADPELLVPSDPKMAVAVTSVTDPVVTPPQDLGGEINEAPYKVSLGDENISTLSGALSLNASDMTLVGRNGLDFSLERTYSSQNAQLFDMSTTSSTSSEYDYRVLFDVRSLREARGYNVTWVETQDYQEDRNGDYNPDYKGGIVISSTNKTGSEVYYTNSGLSSEMTSLKSRVHYGGWDTSNGLPYIRYVYEVNPYSISSSATSSTASISSASNSTLVTSPFATYSEADSYRSSVISKNGSVFSSSSWRGDSYYISIRDVTYYSDSAPEIQPVEVGSYTSYYNRTVKSYEETLYPIGTGWSWKMPSVESKDGKKYVHLADSGTYEVSGSSLKGYTWKDLTYTADTSVVVNGVTSASVLKSENSGTKQYFDATGRLIKMTDTYGNYVQFLYTTHATYGKVLSRIENSVGNAIAITYTPQEVRLTQGDRTVVYTKQVSTAASNKELLTSVTDEAGRRTTYDYAIKAAKFNLLGSTPNTSNPYALVSGVTHPTGAKTVYNYEPNITKRFLASSAVNETYRLASVSDQLVYSNGTVENKNTKTITYTGDMGSSYSTDMTFSVSIQKEGVASKFDQKKDYIDSSLGAVYYNTKVTQSANDEQRFVTKTYDETRRLPVPNQVSNQFIKAGTPAEATTTSQTYDDYGNVMTETDPNGTAKTYVYDTLTHLLKSVTEPISATQTKKTEFTYNAQRSPLQVTIKENDQLLRQQNYEYDSYGNVISSRDKGTTGDLVQQVEYSSQYQYAFPTKLTVQTTDIDGAVQTSSQSFEYSLPLGAMTKWTDGKGNSTAYEYDKLGRTVKQTNADLSTQTVTYRDLQNEVETVDELGLKSLTKFNQLGWKTEAGAILDGVYQAKAKYGYDNSGNPIWEEDALGNRTATKYDPWARPIELTYADLTKSTILYNDALRNKAVTDADGATQRETYDKLGRVVLNETVDAVKGNQVIQKTGYDLAGNMIFKEDGKGARTGYQYNAVQELTSVTDPDGKIISYTYDLLGNQTNILYPDSKQTVKTYDALGRLIKKVDPLGQAEKYYYDANGNLLSKIDRKGQTIQYAYDNRNQLTSKSTPSDVVSYEYDLAGKRTKMTDVRGISAYAYTALGLLAAVQLPDGKSISYAYDAAGNRTKMTDPFGREIFYSINQRNQIGSLSVGSATAAPEAAYTYNSIGQVKTGTFLNGITIGKTYDANKNLVALEQKDQTNAALNTFAYEYDAADNQTQKTENGNIFTFTYDKQRRVETSSQFAETYAYDVRGNRNSLQSDRPLEPSAAGYEYDEWNRLIRVTAADGNVVEYAYDGDGLLYERKENGATTRYYYDGQDIIAEADVVNGAASLKVRYIRGNGLAALETADGQKAYYLHNGHGDVTEIRDANGALLNQYTYDIWGNQLTETAQVHNSFHYAGELQDPSTSLIYLRARWYDPSQGRFINEDTYEGEANDPLSLNLYSYVQNNPLTYIDPSGHRQEGVTKDPNYYEERKNLFGILVHQEVEAYFLGKFGKEHARVETQTPDGKNRLDMGLWDEDFTIFEIYELKPITYHGSTDKNKQGKVQLNRYLNAWSSTYGIKTKAGVSWNPDFLDLPHPTNSNKLLRLYTFYDTDPGVIYYGEVKKPESGNSSSLSWDRVNQTAAAGTTAYFIIRGIQIAGYLFPPLGG
ncbi:hypothetical protein CBW65_04965 [Tumebacillus avium]|uniref:Teneurin-like YD-shell domain-containing protein n=1 Tax=Tumebacillus avium TaxID=1903704 RepID=A0A1Y0IKZ7_9BACL|nr:RHS repeat-associated core domain-containing protein [Tumebacillus avium]ARU60496.1 hypothetical protein CBW65_04965 [Tumebacillus avium]